MNKDALCRAADWLEANPDKHTKVALARNDAGDALDSPFDPAAACFCAYGRAVLEAGEEAKAIFDKYLHDSSIDLYAKLDSILGVEFTEVYDINDGNTVPLELAKPRVIEFLRRSATC